MSEPLLSARDLTVEIGGRLVCRALSLEVASGERWAVLGTNGVGKTTLLHVLAGLHRPTGGEILIGGSPLHAIPRRHVARRLGLMPQDSRDTFPSTVLETALCGRHPHLGLWENEGERDLAIALAALKAVGLGTLQHRDVRTLSGGERRRLALAVLLTQDPAVVLLDEPTNHLDLHQQVRMLEHTGELARAGKGIAMVLHDVNLAARYCDRLLLLFGDGEWAAGPREVLLETELLTRLYGHPILKVAHQPWPVFVPAPG